MVIWRITGNEIGPNGNGAAHFATQKEALAALRDYRRPHGGMENEEAICESDGPFKLVVKNREQLAALLDDAMGYGAS
jgi:hypothetical protein